MTPVIEHVRPPRPLWFFAGDPAWELGQSTRHCKQRIYLWNALRRVVGPASTVGANNFIYFDGADPSRKCAPDGFVRLGVPDHEFPAWWVWEKGAPDLCVEILMNDTPEFLTREQNLAAFHTIGVREVVWFDLDAPVGTRLRAWDRIDGDLVERVVRAERTPCLTIDKWFHVAPLGDQPAALAIADDEAGNGIVLPDGPRAARAEKARIAAEEAFLSAKAGRIAAEARVRELEEILRSKG